jgi:hypothetical protein
MRRPGGAGPPGRSVVCGPVARPAPRYFLPVGVVFAGVLGVLLDGALVDEDFGLDCPPMLSCFSSVLPFEVPDFATMCELICEYSFWLRIFFETSWSFEV